MEILRLALDNLLSPPVLGFALGLVAVLVGGDLRLPDAVYQGLSMYLLLAIGIKGGVALRASSVGDVILPTIAAIGLGVLIPVLAYLILRRATPLSGLDRGAIAAHYGSTSLVTFTAALVFLEASSIAVEGFVTTLLAVMEIPGIVVGLLLAGRAADRSLSWGASLHEILVGKSILLLVGGLVLGVLTGASGYERVEPFFGALFVGILTLFLVELGTLAGRRLPDLKTAGIGLPIFAILFPILAGTMGVTAGSLAGLSVGGATILGVLSASASYIAAPAAVRLALPEANPGYYLTASLGITFPFNLVIGIPLYLEIAQVVGG
ncbi:MAG: sodium-dependent bicarbonate transport family permease [Actinobacteria bacterium]|nr:sodium-dependent bicarbonate transport family permease [Actinomycetota bacterium]